MKALLYRETGGPEVLEYTDVDDPVPGAQDVVVRVAATALNHLDVVQRKGLFSMPGFTLPHIAGMDVAGTVVEIGSEVDTVRVGDCVIVDPCLSQVPDGSKLAGMGALYGEFGIIGANVAGGYAELCLAPSTHVHQIPATKSWHQAVVFPSAWLVAHHAVFATGQLQAGETIMIPAAGCGVSCAAIQLAKQAGATVLATADGEQKCARALTIGADFVADNRTTDIKSWAREVTNGTGVDMVLDHSGPALWAQSILALGPRGRLVMCGNTERDEVTIPSRGHILRMGIQIRGADPYRYEEFEPVWELYCAGDFQATIDSVYPLADGPEAQEKFLRSDFFGKILLTP